MKRRAGMHAPLAFMLHPLIHQIAYSRIPDSVCHHIIIPSHHIVCVRVNVRCVWVLRSCVAVLRVIVRLSSIVELVVCRVRFARVSCPWLRFGEEKTGSHRPIKVSCPWLRFGPIKGSASRAFFFHISFHISPLARAPPALFVLAPASTSRRRTPAEADGIFSS